MQKYEYKVSVIIPVHNTKKYLKKCIDSLLGQSIGSIEVIVVDDASTEDILAFLNDEYGAKENLIYLRNEKALKPGGARNRGMDIAKGKFIGYCDSDDWVDLSLYEQVVNSMEENNADIGMVSMVREYDTLQNNPYFKCKYTQLNILSGDMALRILSHQYNMGIEIVPACINKIYRNSFLKESKSKFEENMYFQGILFSVYTFLRAKRIVCVPDVNYRHYLRVQSITQSFDIQHIKDFEKCFKKIKKYFVETNQYERYTLNYYKLCEHYLNVVVSEIFEYVQDEDMKKKYLQQTLGVLRHLVDVDEYFEYTTAEEIRQHIQPLLRNHFEMLR